MTLSSLMNLSCTVLSRTTSANTDAYGDEIRTETAVVTVCELQQVTSGEAPNEVATTTYRLFLPADTVIDQDDSVVIDGHHYEVTGQPNLHRNPRTGSDSHIEVEIRRSSGADDIGS